MVDSKNSRTRPGSGSNGGRGAKERRRRLHREDWLSRGLAFLQEHGVEGVRIVPLARAFGVTSGSFYWHFRNRQALLSALLAYWDEWSTSQAIEHMEGAEGPPRERLLLLLELVLDRGLGDYDGAMQAWAIHDPEAAEVVARVFARRTRFVAGLLREIGYAENEARTRAHLVAGFMSYVYSPGANLTAEERRSLVRLAHATLTA